MLPLGSSRNTVSPSLFQTAEDSLHQYRTSSVSEPQPVNRVIASPGSSTAAPNRYRWDDDSSFTIQPPRSSGAPPALTNRTHSSLRFSLSSPAASGWASILTAN